MNRSFTLPSLRQRDETASVGANYNIWREQLIKLTPGFCQCRLFCRGPQCKYCISDSWTDDEQAIPGLYSHWVTPNVLASSRPTANGVSTNNLTEKLKGAGIRSIINLQRYGEHASCGPNSLTPSGFSYDPELFMKEDIFHYNFGWPDFGTASLATLLDMVKVLSFAISQGKVLVHCHAGLGRTGVLIACYLIWTHKMDPTSAIAEVRLKRPKSVQTSDQVTTVFNFARFLAPLRQVYTQTDSLATFCQNQRLILHGYEERVLKYIPKLVYVVCERLLELSGHKPLNDLQGRLRVFASGDELFYDRILAYNLVLSGKTAVGDCAVQDSTKQQPEAQQPVAEQQEQTTPVESPTTKKLILPPVPNKNSAVSSVLVAQSECNPETQEPVRISPVIRWINGFNAAPTPTILQLISDYRAILDGSVSSWEKLATENDPVLLFHLMDQWFSTIQTPPICEQNVSSPECDDMLPVKLRKSVKDTLLYLSSVLHQLRGDSAEAQVEFARYMSRWLAHSESNEKMNELFYSCISLMSEASGPVASAL